jgi:Ca2+-binding EF-hand superfamily protein
VQLLDIMLRHKYLRDDPTKIRRAFEILDQSKKGIIEADTLSALLKTIGEPFSEEEVKEMLSAATDPEKGTIDYEKYIMLLVSD